ncbi:MAG: YhdP family protein [Pontibacterium sp.]
MIAATQRLFWVSYWCLAGLIATGALLLATLRMVYPTLPDYRSTIEARLTESSGHKVTIGAMRAYWRGQNPVLELDNLNIAGNTSVTVEKALFALDLPKSLGHLQWIFTELSLEKATVLVKGPGPGKQLAPQPVSFQGTEFLTLLLRQNQVTINQARLVYQGDKLPPLELSDLTARLKTAGKFHQLNVEGSLAKGGQLAPFQWVSEVEGNPVHRPIRHFFKVSQLNAALINPWLMTVSGYRLESLQAGLQVWGISRKGRLNALQASASIEKLNINGQSFSGTHLSSSLLRHSGGYQAQLNGQISANQAAYPLPLITADWRAALEGRPDKIAIKSLDLSELRSWLTAQAFLPAPAMETIGLLKPEGLMNNLVVRWQTPDWASFVLDADLAHVSVAPWTGAPGLRGITGRFQHKVDGGSIAMETHDNFQMSFPELEFPVWQYDFARGRVKWSLKDNAVEVSSGLLQLKNKQVEASGRFFFRMPYDRNKQTDLALLIGVKNSQGIAFKDYIPPAEVGRETHRWLMGALQGGTVRTGGFMLNANTRSRLSNYQKPTVQLFLDLKQFNFAFDPQWPAVTQGDGHFFYRDRGFLAEASGTLLESRIHEAWVYKAPEQDQLQILGHTGGDAADIRRILLETPIRDELDDQIKKWHWSGKANTALDIGVSLSQKQPALVKASSQLSQGRLVSAEHRLSFEAIKGELQFDSDTGLSSDALSGSFFGRPVEANLDTRIDDDLGRISTLEMQGIAEITQVQEWLNQPYLAIAEGTTAYQAKLQICASNPGCNRLDVNSNLQGIRVDAPLPLGKTADESLPLKLQYTLGDARQQLLWIDYANTLKGVFQLQQDRLERAHLTLGGKAARLPKETGLWVEGDLDSLDVMAVKDLLARTGFNLVPGANNSSEGISLGEDAQEASTALPSLFLKDIRLNIKALTSGGMVLHNLEVHLQQQPNGWLWSGHSETLKGSFFMPLALGEVCRLNLDYLNLDLNTPSSGALVSKKTGDFDLSGLPLMDVRVADLSVNNKPFGDWFIEMRPDAEGVTLQNIKADMLGTAVLGDARWSSAGEGHTTILLDFKGTDISALLEAWGYGHLVESHYLSADVRLVWPGAPWHFAVDQLAGNFSLLTKDGRILEAGQSGQFLRVLGILNLETIARRLRLDFSDLLKQGLAFDRISARYAIAEGIASTSAPFVLTGPSADMQLTGALDLVNETVDQDMQVVLPLTKNLPLMGVLLGQPQVAGAVYLIDKLIGKRLERFSTINYHLSGDWSDPEVVLRQQSQSVGPEDEVVFPLSDD